MPTNKNVMAYIARLIFQSPLIKLSPANVEDTTEGNLAKVDISINLSGFIGNNPAIYTSKSFGVPGTINNIIIIHSIFFGFFNNLLFSIFFTFSSSQMSYTNLLPSFLTKKNIAVVMIHTDIVINNK